MATPATCNNIRLKGQKHPFSLRVQEGLEVSYHVSTIQGLTTRQVVKLFVETGGKQKALHFNDAYSVEFMGPGVWIRKSSESEDIIVFDEFGTNRQTVYIFEEHQACFWVKRCYSDVRTADELSRKCAIFLLEQKDCVWHVCKGSRPGFFEVFETRDGVVYFHSSSETINNTKAENLIWHTDTDYTFEKSGHNFSVTYPNGETHQLRNVTNSSPLPMY